MPRKQNPKSISAHDEQMRLLWDEVETLPPDEKQWLTAHEVSEIAPAKSVLPAPPRYACRFFSHFKLMSRLAGAARKISEANDRAMQRIIEEGLK
ncbi:MAG: hypothetical protein HOC91_02755 [Nitrospinaceae bacterium]|jgi:hypothetical protein|nr:hypothetical protein [Nitrospinaceae bacterium]MBT3435769.1 hypothetical protein [Nitrospinaceae bacterium]MBT4093196.1 hypothetical protein [Nitrospinaceae bacterium]MBT4429413.1 hypothetical protein [Nitrospinaceae bacterium]MBT5369122.1 hypothetical protein [Nitrospinaceae bacterium]